MACISYLVKRFIFRSMNSSQSFDYITYGAKCSALEVKQFLQHVLAPIFRDEGSEVEERPTPVCIWGRHGIGKTELVQEMVTETGCAYAYIAPAQFEEMGDLLGMPTIVENASGQSVTEFMPPAWVPQVEGPGILLIDDVNRADDRILRGIMQLLQNYALGTWTLPARWQIILTANPDGGDYSVTPLDHAMLTRMLHITLVFDLQSWTQWAERKGIDSRGINFVLAYPELINQERTTPRTLVQFFRALSQIKDFSGQLPLVKMLADATLEPETGAAFIGFVREALFDLVEPAAILQTSDFTGLSKQLAQKINQETKRLDILAILCTRMTNHLLARQAPLSAKEVDQLRAFLLLDFIPNDLRLKMVQDLAGSEETAIQELLATPELANVLLLDMG